MTAALAISAKEVTIIIPSSSKGWLRVPIKSWAEVVESRLTLGRLYATPGVLDASSRADINDALRSHTGGDWGEGPPNENEDAIKNGGEVLSIYRLSGSKGVCVRTWFGQLITLVSLESELDEEA